MKYKLIALDIDGTLLNDDHELTPRVKRAVTAAASAGAEIVLCTGRGSASALSVLAQLGLSGTVITHNGASIVDGDSREILRESPIGADETARYLDLCRERGIHFDLNTAFDIYVERLSEDTSAMYANMLAEPILRSREDLFPERTVKISIFAPKADLDELEAHWRDWRHELQTIRSGDYFIDLQHREASKGTALGQWAEKRAIPRENVLAVGNYFNDIGMLQYAGYGVAMGNSPPEVKAVADAVTATNNEDGVALVLEACLAAAPTR
ncbi:Cof-type HAD-IIB family hydrolase [Cohnella rhizosphaerae]|uniref:Cof-type HAD-IIB family hydrolase n=1 Tax=Cohnella rhizosphaerae TaxID=1457232 RepID=A0A9X4KZD9_9BACL|nr:Cof-type HAD-IIB family hydrolase [Cohnella rhizosphaerae]MDG0813618.1 Cof-type HAD-IIB family hydrolase [Cohnella rhizosphaerae]